MTIIVTGAAGFIGYHVSEVLLARGDQVIGIDNLNDYYDVTLKQGKTGPLCFVTVEQKITCDGRHVLNMRQDIVYRGAVQLTNDRPTAVNVPKQAPEGTHCRRVTPTPPYLFRYSAITMNAHRIHYDVP